MRYVFNTYQLIKNIVPYFLQFAGDIANWNDLGGLFWITSSGQQWGSGSDNRHLDWLKSLSKPLFDTYELFRLVTVDILYRMNLTGQVIYLEHYLNDLFNNVERRIIIKDGTLDFPPYIYNKSENEADLFIYNKSENEDPFYLYNINDYGGEYEFIVCVPAVITLTEELTNRIKSAVNQYKQAGVRYTVESY